MPQNFAHFVPDEQPSYTNFVPDAGGDSTPPDTPLPTMEARPETGSNYMQDVINDLRGGGTRTMVGRGLGYMQGRGSRGYTGLESGTTPATADIMGSAPLGMAKMGLGYSETNEGHPLSGLKDIALGGLQTATIPSMFAGPEASYEAINEIPSRTHAAQILNDISSSASDVPVIPHDTMPALDKWREFTEAGGRATKPITKMSNRLEDILTPKTGELPAEPMNFPEGRRFYTNISRTTAKPGFLRRAIESPAMPDLRRNAGNVRMALNNDLTNTASSIGRGDEYTNALREYAQASKLRKFLQGAGAIGAGEVARRTGLLGKIVSGTAKTTQ